MQAPETRSNPGGAPQNQDGRPPQSSPMTAGAPPAPTIPVDQAKPKKRSPIPFIILGIIVLVATIFGYSKYSYGQSHITTDNAQVDGNISPVIPKIAGFVTDLRVKENMSVKKGDTLLKLDDRDLIIRVKQAEIALRIAQANSRAAGTGSITTSANTETSKANIESARVRYNKAQQDFKRYDALLTEKSATQQQYDNAKAEVETSKAMLEVAQKQYSATGTTNSTAQDQISIARIQIDQRQSELEFAKLQLSYAIVIAQADGNVNKKNVQLGQYVQAGQSLFSIVQNDDVWVTANLKETQLERLNIGQPVEIEVDAYSGEKFTGRVESISAATGAKFSMLPPDNASGNFVKVVQRVSVRIAVPKDEQHKKLRAGMNVNVAIITKS